MTTDALISWETLWRLCNENGWFTEGTNSQYKKLYDANKSFASVEDLATIIWVCSDEDHWTRKKILERLKEYVN